MQKNNLMRNIRIEKITLNVGAGKDEGVLQRGVKLFKLITGVEPVKTITRKRVPSWGLRPGLAIGCKYTLRGEKATELLKRLLESKDNRLSMKQFDKEGNFSFGISEYIDIPGVEYDPEIKIMGFEVAVTLERPGFHIKKRKINARSIPQKHRITKEDAIQYMKDNFSLIIAEEEE